MMTMSSRDSKTLYAGMWDFRRKGWTFRSGGESPDRAQRQRVLQEPWTAAQPGRI